MNKFPLLLLAVTLVSAHSNVFPRSGVESQEEGGGGAEEDYQYNSIERRHLLQESTCTLFRKCVSYPATKDHENGYHEESWSCKLSNENARTIQEDYLDIVETTAISAFLQDAVSGESTLSFSRAIVDKDATRLHLPHDAAVRVNNNIPSDALERKDSNSKKPSKFGTKSALVIRVIDTNDVEPIFNSSTLETDIFGDDFTFKTQIQKCSYSKFQVEPYRGLTPNKKTRIKNGVVDVKVNGFKVSLTDFPSHARSAAKEQLGDLDDPRIDLVMYCFPPGLTDKGIAWAYANNKYSFYSTKWCKAIGSLMHEVGHNIGLGHSGAEGDTDAIRTYGDGSGAMGMNPGKNPVNICYNAQKSYQLGWYADKTDTFYPVGKGNRIFKLNSVNDYMLNDNALVVLRLEQKNKPQDYYIGFNRAKGRTKDIKTDKNRVSIILKEKGDPNEYSQSTRVASLLPGQRHLIKNFDGIRTVQIRFIAYMKGNARIEVVDNGKGENANIQDDCADFTIEFTTDNYPDRNFWYITKDSGVGTAHAASPAYTKAKKTYIHEVCLPKGSSATVYKFTVLDDKQRGAPCTYNVYDEEGNVVAFGDDSNKFESRNHFIEVPALSACEDDESFLLRGIPGKDCNYIGTEKERFCPRRNIYEACPMTCNECQGYDGDCRDKPDFTYRGQPGRDCDWVKIKQETKPDICIRFSGKKRVHTFCPKTCGKC